VRTSRRGVFVALMISSVSLFAATPPLAATPALAGAEPPPLTEHCSLAIVGVDEDGVYETGPLVCDTSRTAAASSAGFSVTSILATHYEGHNFSGASLSISGGSCNGGWLNLPVSWRDRIASTVSGCTTRHYSQLDKGGSVNTTFNPGGNLTTVAFRAESVKYD
jgi:hypothetical protein